MKHTLLITTALIITALMLIIGCGSSEKVPINYKITTFIEARVFLTAQNEIFYGNAFIKPYSGPVFTLYENGRKKSKGNLKDGEKDGLWTEWYESGNIKSQATWKDGE